jgi:hypothetical protein
VLIGIRFAPNVEIGVIGHPTSNLVNDTRQTVVVLRCVRTCEQPDQPVQLGPGRTLRLEPGSAVAWLVVGEQGARLGCITLPASSGRSPGRVYVSRAAACRS